MQSLCPQTRPQGSNLYRVPTPNEIGDPSTDFLHPDFNPRLDGFVELVVSNLDYNIQPREWSKIIYATFHPHVKVHILTLSELRKKLMLTDLGS